MLNARRLWLAVINSAMDDLANAIDCNCSDVEGWHCKRCGEYFSPWDETSFCSASTGPEGRHLFNCHHGFRSARRLLLGTSEEYRAWRDEVCLLAGVPVMKVKDRALELLKSRRKEAA